MERILDPRPRKRYPAGYGRVYPVADYEPWRIDAEFAALYRRVVEHTKVDIYRCYELWRLAGQAAKLSGDLLEVGVWRGGTGALLAARVAQRTGAYNGNGFGAKRVFLADTFSGVVKAGANDAYYRGGEHADTSPKIVQRLLEELEIDNAELLCGVFPDETGERIRTRRFSLVHIDVDVYQSARDTVEWVWPSLAVGGVVVYDDYGFYGCEGVTRLVHEEYERSDRLVMHNLNGHAVVTKLR